MGNMSKVHIFCGAEPAEISFNPSLLYRKLSWNNFIAKILDNIKLSHNKPRAYFIKYRINIHTHTGMLYTHM